MNGTSRRAWVKNVAIIFLIVLLLLTFFSNTILNYSLPEVSVQYASYDSITNAIKVSGTVKANESYVVTYDEADDADSTTTVGQTRKIVSVYVKQGSEVQIGDPIIALKGGATKELEEAEKSLRELEKQYALDKITDTINDLTSDKSKTENERQLADYYKQLSNKKELYEKLLAGTDPTETLKAQKKAQEKEVAAIQKQIDEINTRITEIKGKISAAEGNIVEDYSGKSLTERYNEAKQNYEVLQGEYDTLTARVKELKGNSENLSEVSEEVKKAYAISQEIDKLNETIDSLNAQIKKLQDGQKKDESTANNNAKIIAEMQTAVNTAEKNLKDFNDKHGVDYQAQKKEYDAILADLERINTLISLCEEQPGYMDLNVDELLKERERIKAQKDSAKTDLIDEYNRLDGILTAAKANLSAALKGNSSSSYGDNITGGSSSKSTEEQIAELQKQLQIAQNDLAVNHEKLRILGMPYIDDLTDYYINNQDESTKKEYNKLKAQLDEITADYEKAKTEYESLQKQMNSTGTISDNKVLLETFTRDLQSYTDKKDAADEILKDIEEDLQAAQTENNKKPEEVEDEITKLQNDITTLEKQMKIDSATESKNDVESKYTREDQVKQIADLKEKIEKIKAAPEETLVTAPIAGKIVSIDYVPGNSITSGTEVAKIEVADKGYICEVSMTTDQARKVQIGAECSIVNSWWFSDVKASVSQIRSDPQSQGQKKIVVITVTGDVSEGQSLNFSIGDKSQSYESVLPKTALREDKEGKFVLVVESKSTPLGVRYKAVRYNVEVVASDDTKCAVSGLYGNESIITTSTSPISDGQQVRLAEK